MGTVYDMICEDGVEDPFAMMPAVILVAVDKYTGSASMAINDIYVVPVVPAEAQWEVKHKVCQRKQFPLMLAFAITIHKSQSLTLARVVLNFEKKDVTFGLSYVALSRIRDIGHLMFEAAFSRIAEGLARRYGLAERPEQSEQLQGKAPLALDRRARPLPSSRFAVPSPFPPASLFNIYMS
ncbi:hypothetical protein MMC22_004446 [Lobaria immixta]|nr:hypothetical protein [Lobaria immixta]